MKLVVLAGVLGGALAGFLEADRRGYVPRIEPPKEEKPLEPIVPLADEKPRQDGLRPAMAPVIGYVVARRKAAVGAARAGKIVEVFFDEGSRVEAGQLIAKLDDAVPRAEVERVKAQLPTVDAELARIRAQVPTLDADVRRAEAVIADAKRELERLENLVKQNVARPAEADQARSRLEVANAEHQQARARYQSIKAQEDEARSKLAIIEAELKLAQEQVAQCEVRAPFAGTVVVKNAEVGETTSGPSPGLGAGTTGTVIATIADLSSPEVEADVPEARIAELSANQSADVELDAFAGTRLKGTLRLILPAADRRKATVPVRVSVQGELASKLRPDMSARVTFLTKAPPVVASREATKPIVREPPPPPPPWMRAVLDARAAWAEEATRDRAVRYAIGLGLLLAGLYGLRFAIARRATQREAEPPPKPAPRPAPPPPPSEEAPTPTITTSSADGPSVAAAPRWSAESSASSEDAEPKKAPPPRKKSRASFRVLASNSISDVESVDEIFVVDDAEDTQAERFSLGERRVYDLKSDGRIGDDPWLLRSHRTAGDRAALEIDGAALTFVIEGESGVRLLPGESTVEIEAVKVPRGGVPLVHGMVFEVDGRPYLYLDRAANEAERRRVFVVETDEEKTSIQDKVLVEKRPKKKLVRDEPPPSESSDVVLSSSDRAAPAPPKAAPSGDVIVSIRGLEKSFQRGTQTVRVLNGLDLDVPDGDFLALMGPSGSGKSTLLNIIAGIDRPTAGSVKIAEQEISRLPEAALATWRASAVGFIFQFYNLIPVLSAIENVELPLLLTQLSRSERRKRALAALELVGLADRVKHLPKELSGGQEQRVAIARALVTDPVILVADEPTGDLDSENAEAVLDLLVRLNDELGKTIIMVTHDPRAAERAKHVKRLEKGVLIREEEPR